MHIQYRQDLTRARKSSNKTGKHSAVINPEKNIFSNYSEVEDDNEILFDSLIQCYISLEYLILIYCSIPGGCYTGRVAPY